MPVADQYGPYSPMSLVAGWKDKLHDPLRKLGGSVVNFFPRQFHHRAEVAQSLCRENLFASRLSSSHFIVVAVVVLTIVWPVMAAAQETKFAVRVLAGSPACAVVQGASAPARTWSFANEYGGVSQLATRITAFRVYDGNNRETGAREIGPGQFSSSSDATRFQYRVALGLPAIGPDAAHRSWFDGTRGVLMLADLLPDFGDSTQTLSAGASGTLAPAKFVRHPTVTLDLPPGFTAYSSESLNGAGTFDVPDAKSAVIFFGKALRVSHQMISGTTVELLTDTEWAFTDVEALTMVNQIVKAHRETFDLMPANRVIVALIPLSAPAGAKKWTAETRGTSVTILLARETVKNVALAQLSVPLTHELFHLWIPNGVNLSGDYDWFYEGFTVYQAARSGVRLGFLSFQDFLNAIARAYDSYLTNSERNHWSLVDASARRWTTGESIVYSKSMLVAFVYDLSLRYTSNRKFSLDDIYRALVRRFGHVGTSTDGTRAVTEVLDERLPGFSDQYIQKAAAIDLSVQLEKFGLRLERFGALSRITISESPTRQQRDLLRDLGYNAPGHVPRTKKP
jgi:hypothetical protein